MFISLPFSSFRPVLLALVLVSTFWSCSDDPEEPAPIVGPTETSFSLVDSIKVDSRYETAAPELWNNYRGKTYVVNSTNKAEAYFYEEDQALVLVLRDTSRGDEQAFVSFTFPNRTVANLPASVSATQSSVVCVEGGQQFEGGSSALSGGCLLVLDGTLNLQYDASAQVLSGSVTNLKVPLEYYVPEYSFPNHYGPALKASGSSRNLNITFKNVNRYKSK